MIYVAVAALGILMVNVVVTAGILRQVLRQHAREREQLLARIMHLSGRTWETPPSREQATDEPTIPAYSWGDDAPVAS